MASRHVFFGLSLLGCGPLVGVQADGTSGGTEGMAEATTSPGTSSSTTTVPVTSSTSDPSTTTFDPSSGSEDVTTGCLSFICPEETEPPPAECSVWDQDCPDGEKCMPWANDGGNAWNSTTCSPIADNPAGPGEPCMAEGSAASGIDNCDGTSMCFADPMTLLGTCRAFCEGDESNPYCAEECHVCPLSGDGVLTICLPTCDPIAQDCNDGEACYAAYVDEFLCVPDASGNAGAPGDVCEFVNVCDVGVTCIDSEVLPECEGIGCCTPFCTVGDSTPCEVLPGTECVPLFEEGQGPSCGPSNIGVCSVP